jgi:hypothetical protein
MTLTTGKAAIRSKSVQGAVIAILGTIALTFEQLGKLPTGTTEGATNMVTQVVTGLGGLWALIGALTRKERITSIL